MSSNKMSVCKHCGAEIAANAKSCPQCGGKNKKPIYKRGWFIALCVIVVIAAVSSTGGEGSAPAGDVSGDVSGAVSVVAPVEQEIVYATCTVDEMMDMLDGNAMKAENTYNDQYVEVTGRLGNIDSDGKYISIYPIKDQWAFIGVQCYIKTDEQKQQVMEMSIDDKVTVRGQIKSVGEVMGYSLNIIEIVE